jgi:hypothetical protein
MGKHAVKPRNNDSLNNNIPTRTTWILSASVLDSNSFGTFSIGVWRGVSKRVKDGRATPETAVRPFHRCPAHRA